MSSPVNYTLDTVIVSQSGRSEIYIPDAQNFHCIVQDYIGGFLNTTGGIVHFGVSPTGRVAGVSCTRTEEDGYKLATDNIVRLFQPKVSPTLYRLDFISVISHRSANDNWKVISLHVSAGPEILYMDALERVMVRVSNGIYGPLRPQEIQRLAIHKYKQEILNAENLMKVITPMPTESRHKTKLNQKSSSQPEKEKSPPRKRKAPETTCMMCQTTPGLIQNATSRTADMQGTAPFSSEGSPSGSDQAPTESPSFLIIDGDDSDLQCLGALESTIITIRDSSDSSDGGTDETVTSTPVRDPGDLFASPGCSTVKRVTRPQPALSPVHFPTAALDRATSGNPPLPAAPKETALAQRKKIRKS